MRHIASTASMTVLVLAGALGLAAPGAARAAGILDEVKLGVFDHDASVLGHQKETGADFNAELLFASPDLLAVIGAPRPVVGILANSSGDTSQAYVGLTWDWTLIRNILGPDDSLYVEGTLGGAVHDGKLDVQGPLAQKRKSLGSPVLFREDLDIGYRINPIYAISISYNHISDADLAKRNEGLNDVGIRLGIHF